MSRIAGTGVPPAAFARPRSSQTWAFPGAQPPSPALGSAYAAGKVPVPGGGAAAVSTESKGR